MKDKRGTQLGVGDQVSLPAVVKEVHRGDPEGRVTLEVPGLGGFGPTTFPVAGALVEVVSAVVRQALPAQVKE